jgi:ABC-type dipeptide/oligopeptide/nickel transport system ATPase subunit
MEWSAGGERTLLAVGSPRSAVLAGAPLTWADVRSARWGVVVATFTSELPRSVVRCRTVLSTERWSGGAVPRRKLLAATSPAPRLPEAGDRPTAPDVILSVRGLSVCYPATDGDRIAVHDVSLRVVAGETLGIVGESGSGKTAIARAVLGILRGGHIAGGHILLAGKDITGIAGFSPDMRAGLHISYIAQEPHASLDPTWRVGSLVAESLRRHRGLGRRAAWQAAIELFQRVHLDDPETVARKHPHELSGGMAQRVAIARALGSSPRLLVADEPTTALDVTVQAGILDLLRGIQADTGMAMLLITHDWGVVADICDPRRGAPRRRGGGGSRGGRAVRRRPARVHPLAAGR